MANDFPCRLEYVQRKNLTEKVEDLTKEKADLIEQIIQLKRENMRFDLQTKRYQDDIQTNAAVHSAKIDGLEKKISTLQKKLNEIKQTQAENMGTIQMLTKQNKLYVAQINQLRKSTNTIQNTQTEKSDDTDDSEYDVESIQKHKGLKGKRLFLVRWKGFSSKDDTWIPEHDLFCPKILADYKKTKKLR